MTDTKFVPGEYRTRDGRKARVYATDGALPDPLHGAILGEHGWAISKWKSNGKWMGCDYPGDLMPPKQVRYVNVYASKKLCMFAQTRDAADGLADADRIACIRIEFTEGQYDD